MRRRSGFTLIELLVVIAIIAILAAILFPVFTSAKASAQKTQCLSNFKQFSAALQMYTQNSDGVFPALKNVYAQAFTDIGGTVYNGEQSLTSSSWINYARKYSIYKQMSSYLKSGGVWRCPSDSPVNVDTNFVLNKRFSSYAYRWEIGSFQCPHNLAESPSLTGWQWRESMFPSSSKVITWHEQFTFHDPRSDSTGLIADAGMNVALMDGHVITVKVGKAFSKAAGYYDYHWFSKSGYKDL